MALCMLRADLRRVMRRVPRLIILAVLFAAVAWIFLDSARDDSLRPARMMITYEEYFVGMAGPIVLGLLEMVFLLSDDFKAGTIRCAIGSGISKARIVIYKFLDLALLTLVDIVVLFGLPVLIAVVAGMLKLDGNLWETFLLSLFTCWLKTIMCLSLSMILVYFMQDTLLASLLYIAIASTLIGQLLQVVLQLKTFTRLHLDQFVPTIAFKKFYTQLILGNFHVASAVIILCVIAVSLFLSILIFKDSELEF